MLGSVLPLSGHLGVYRVGGNKRLTDLPLNMGACIMYKLEAKNCFNQEVIKTCCKERICNRFVLS